MKSVDKPVKRASDLAPDDNFLHIGIWAQTGAGKTFLMNEVHKDVDGASILIAQPKDDDDYKLFGEKTKSKGHLRKQLKSGKKIHFNPPTNSKKFLEEVNAIYEVCKKVSGRVRVFVDEVHRISHTRASDGLMQFGDIMTDARGHGVRFMIASQDLNRFSNKTGRVVLGACQMHVFLQIDEMAKGFYKYYSFPWREARERIDGRDYVGVRYSSGDGLSQPFRLKA